jgi:histidine triad (HIT) family protein
MYHDRQTHTFGGIMGESTRHCIFCEIVHGAGEASICFEDAQAIAFMDIQPVNAGHVLIVPRDHYESLNDVPEPVAMHLFQVALTLGPIVRRLTGSDDLNVVVNSGEAAGQNVFHYHVHLIPRHAGDGFDVPLPYHGSAMPDRTLLDAMAVRIIAELRDPVRRARPARSVAVP